jgi:hypothetical protein
MQVLLPFVTHADCGFYQPAEKFRQIPPQNIEENVVSFITSSDVDFIQILG